MRSVKLSNGISIDVRGLTRRQVRVFKSNGIDFGNLSLECAEQAMDAVLVVAVSDEIRAALEDLPYADSTRVWRAIMSETYGDAGEEKNCSTAGSGSATPGGPNTAKPAGI